MTTYIVKTEDVESDRFDTLDEAIKHAVRYATKYQPQECWIEREHKTSREIILRLEPTTTYVVVPERDL